MLPIGTKVLMSEVGRGRYRNNRTNPYTGVGVIISCREGQYYSYIVEWDTGCTNVYKIDELNPVVVNKELEDYL
jgi:hypothetical protein